jgi:hypothetical protein
LHSPVEATTESNLARREWVRATSIIILQDCRVLRFGPLVSVFFVSHDC